MFGLDGYTGQVHSLIAEVKRYLELEKRYIAMDAADKMTVLLSAVATGAVCFVIVAMVLFFVLMATALWVGQVAGNIAIGFLAMSLVLLLLLVLFWMKRKDWIVQPLARLMVSLFVREDTTQKEATP